MSTALSVYISEHDITTCLGKIEKLTKTFRMTDPRK